jgi:hypothetical protein
MIAGEEKSRLLVDPNILRRLDEPAELPIELDE